MIASLLIVFYASLFYWLISRSNFFELGEVSRLFLFFIFTIKILVGISYGLIHQEYFHGGDTFLYFEDSKLIYQTFWDYPQYYIYSILGWETTMPDALVFTYPESSLFWKDLGTYIVVHFYALLHTLSFGYYSVQVVFVAMLGLLASVNFYKVFKQQLKIPSFVLIGICFFVPSLLFWASGLHKDVFIYFGLSLVLRALSQIEFVGFSWKRGLSLISGIVVVGLIRYYLLAILIPATLAYCWVLYRPKRPLLKFGATYLAIGLIGILLSYWLLPVSIFQILADRQANFLNETGYSSLSLSTMEPSFWGVLTLLPEAVLNVGFRPFLWECKDFFQVLAGIEIAVFWLLVILVLRLPKANMQQSPLTSFMLFYSVSNMIMVGLLVANTGTIVRYRAIALSLLVVVMIHLLNFAKLQLFKPNLEEMTQASPLAQQTKENQQIPVVH